MVFVKFCAEGRIRTYMERFSHTVNRPAHVTDIKLFRLALSLTLKVQKSPLEYIASANSATSSFDQGLFQPPYLRAFLNKFPYFFCSCSPSFLHKVRLLSNSANLFFDDFILFSLVRVKLKCYLTLKRPVRYVKLFYNKPPVFSFLLPGNRLCIWDLFA